MNQKKQHWIDKFLNQFETNRQEEILTLSKILTINLIKMLETKRGETIKPSSMQFLAFSMWYKSAHDMLLSIYLLAEAKDTFAEIKIDEDQVLRQILQQVEFAMYLSNEYAECRNKYHPAIFGMAVLFNSLQSLENILDLDKLKINVLTPEDLEEMFQDERKPKPESLS